MGSNSAKAIFDGDDSRLQAVVRRIDASLFALQSKFKAIGKVLGGPTLVGVGIAAVLAAGVKSALDMGGTLNDLSANTGIAIDDLVALRQEFANAGQSADQVGTVIARMHKTLASGSADSTIARLGLDLDALRKRSPAEQFHEIGAAIASMQDPAERAQAAMEIFGKSGASLLAVFASGGFGEAAAQVGNQAQLLKEDAALFDSVSDRLSLSGTKVQGFFVGVADRVAPILNSLLDRFSTMDLSGLGQQVGDFIAIFAEAFAGGQLSNLISESLQVGFGSATNALFKGLVGVIYAIGTMLGQVFGNIMTVLSLPTKATFWQGLMSNLAAFGASFIALLTRGLAKLYDSMRELPGVGKSFGAGADMLNDISSEYEAGAKQAMQDAAGGMAGIGEILGDRFMKNGKELAGSFSEGFNSTGDMIDLSSVQNALGKRIGSLIDKTDKRRTDAIAKTAGTAALPLIEAPTISEPAITALARIGGAFGGGGRDPLIDEARVQSGLLRDIRDVLAAGGNKARISIESVYA